MIRSQFPTGGWGGFFSSAIPVLFGVLFVLVFAVVIVFFLRGLLEWHKNNRSPRLTVEARVAAKRTDVSSHTSPVGGDVTGAHGMSVMAHTWYYVTFETKDGTRTELSVSGEEYGLLAEGDRGRLHVQGTRFLGFDRAGTAEYDRDTDK
jgi:hypothetical protein